MIWIQFLAAALVIVFAGVRLARFGDMLGEKTGLGRSWVGVVLLAATTRQAFVGSLFIAITTSLPEIVVSLAAVRIGAIDLGIANVLGSNLFNLLILGLDDVFYRQGPVLSAADGSHAIAVLAIVTMNALFLIGLTYRVMTKRFAVSWDTGAMAVVYVTAVTLAYMFRG